MKYFINMINNSICRYKLPTNRAIVSALIKYESVMTPSCNLVYKNFELAAYARSTIYNEISKKSHLNYKKRDIPFDMKLDNIKSNNVDSDIATMRHYLDKHYKVHG